MATPTEATTAVEPTVVLDGIEAQIIQHQAITDLIADLKAQSEALAAIIREAMGEHVVGTVRGAEVVSLPFRTRTSTDKRVVESLLSPEDFAKTQRTTQYRPLIHKGRPDATHGL